MAEEGTLEAALAPRDAVLRLLGRGGMGAVYLGRERALDRDVAINQRERSNGALITLYRLLAELVGGLPAGAGGRALDGRLRDASAEALRVLASGSTVSVAATPLEDLPTVPR